MAAAELASQVRNHRRKSAEHQDQVAGSHKSAAADLSAFPVDKLDGFAVVVAAAAAADKSVQEGSAVAGTGSTAFEEEEEEEEVFVDKPSAAADKAAAAAVEFAVLPSVEDKQDLENPELVQASNRSTLIRYSLAFGRRATSWPSLVPCS